MLREDAIPTNFEPYLNNSEKTMQSGINIGKESVINIKYNNDANSMKTYPSKFLKIGK